jgi:predicted dehydrogenase
MIRFAVIGTNWITQRFIDAAQQSGVMVLSGIYSRYPPNTAITVPYFPSLQALASSHDVDAVYIASPNALHTPQAELMLRHGKHVICEKPLAANAEQAKRLIACAQQHQVVLFEAFKTCHVANFHKLQQSLDQLGPLHKAVFNFCQYAPQYSDYLDGELPNLFNPTFCGGSLMDVGYYGVASSIALFGKPQQVLASATLLPSGVDAQGTAILSYRHHARGNFDVVIHHAKTCDSYTNSEIQGELGTLEIERLSQIQRLFFTPRQGARHEISETQYPNTMQYEIETFAQLVNQQQFSHPWLTDTLNTANVLDIIRQQTGVRFPADLPATPPTAGSGKEE